ncbi:hypothetical protein FHR32_001446 [Streptosporangium album]|uniref:Uncharacterized protein n=1 Tax=Streptosporangium album TaxID=47479 RepID=A0A7W7W7U8_9ACTN|nr:hypothetical protein [Streptosporangium album]MBB4937141.1 hypothetical protein [Streptosporangium album]
MSGYYGHLPNVGMPQPYMGPNPYVARSAPLPPAGFGPPPHIPEPIGPKVLKALKKAGRWSVYLAPAIFIAGTAIVNEPGMAQAASNWKHGIAGRLDDGIKQLLPQLVATSRTNWIAMDQQEFERVIWLFHREIGVLRGIFGDIGGMLDEVAAGYRSYWLKLASLAVTTATLLVFAKRMQALPQTRFWGMLLEKFVTTAANGTVAVLTLTLGSALKAAGDVMSTMLKKDHQFGYIMPDGDAKVDFKQATIDSGEYPSYQQPPAPGRLPKDYRDFDWIAPKVDGPKP